MIEHESAWAEFRAEFRDFFDRRITAVVGVSLATGIGSAVVVPSAPANWQERILVGFLGVLLGLAALTVIGGVAALIRIPIGDYRKRHRRKRLGEQAQATAHAILTIAFESTGAEDWDDLRKASSDEELAIVVDYNTRRAATVFNLTEGLRRQGVIDQVVAEELNEHPDDLLACLKKANLLSGIALRLGAGPPPEIEVGP